MPGYEARIIDEAGREVPNGVPGRLAVRGPTGCRYLDDKRQADYVQHGWNVTGDTYVRDDDGYFIYQARSDDMIISAGYNIAGPEVETVLLTHPAVAECGVVGAPDADRGHVVKAYVILKPGFAGDAALTRALQDYVKATVAPYKYPRAIEYVTALPRTETGKLQRFELRRIASTAPPRPAKWRREFLSCRGSLRQATRLPPALTLWTVHRIRPSSIQVPPARGALQRLTVYSRLTGMPALSALVVA